MTSEEEVFQADFGFPARIGYRHRAWQKVQFELFGRLRRSLHGDPERPPSLPPPFAEGVLGTWWTGEHLFPEIPDYSRVLHVSTAVCTLLAGYRLYCEARTRPDAEATPGEIDAALRQVSGYPAVCEEWRRNRVQEKNRSQSAFQREQRQVIRDWVRLLRQRHPEKPAGESHAKVRTTVALAGEGATFVSGLAHLEFERLPNGDGQIFQHPLDMLEWSHADGAFEEALRHAFAVALAIRKPIAPVDVRWRLLQGNEEPVREVTGRSAGGAACLALTDLLGGPKHDPHVLAMTTIDENGNLGPVTAIHLKVEAVVVSNRERAGGFPILDTLALTDQRHSGSHRSNLREAERKLRDLQVTGMRVANIAQKRDWG